MAETRGTRHGARIALVVLAVALVAGCGPATPVSPSSAPVSPPPAEPATSGPDVTLAPVGNLAPVGATQVARVVRIVDGDTLIIDRGLGNERLRYIGMDTPESVKPNTPVEFMAHEATAANTALVAGREVVLETDVSDTDRFGRLLRYVWLRETGGWLFVNLELVRRGFAQAASFPPDVRWQAELRQAQRDAREAGLGLWGPATPAP